MALVFFTFRKILAIFIFIVPLTLTVRAQDPYMQAQINAANGKINAINITTTTTSRQVGNLEDRLNTIKNELYLEVSRLSNRVRALEESLATVIPIMETNQEQITTANSKITELNTSLTTANGKIVKLVAVHQIWQKNFRAVIKTFASLRQKIQFSTPTLRAIPANYLAAPRGR